MATTYKAIATVTVTGATAATINFTSIPATYTDLCILASFRLDTAPAINTIKMEINSDTTGTNYTSIWLEGNGSTIDNNIRPTITAVTSTNSGGSTANTFGNLQMYFPNYANTSYYKSFSIESVGENNATAALNGLYAGLYESNSVISSISLASYNAGNFVQYSSATLYGIKNS